jgi:hypothetical protein
LARSLEMASRAANAGEATALLADMTAAAASGAAALRARFLAAAA